MNRKSETNYEQKIVRFGGPSRMANTVREDEELEPGEPWQYRERREDFDRRWVAYLFVDGTADCRPLKGRVTGNLIKKSAVCDSKRDAQERVAEWLEGK